MVNAPIQCPESVKPLVFKSATSQYTPVVEDETESDK